ncbi:zinc finger BED domain-containing protein RICESLEEPER 2-like protein [Tanacetum coccineum]
MMKRVIAFEDFPVPHTGGALARMLRKVFVNFNLEDKIMSITLDNASTNTSAIGKPKLKYEPPMDGRFYHSRCVAHIIDLVVQDDLAVPAINAIKESFRTMLKDVFKSGGRNHQRYIKICADAGKPSKESTFPVLSRMAMDIINVQATSVASEFVFSTSGRVLSIQRTKLTPASLEMCMCLKDHLDAQERKQDKSDLENPVDFEEEILDAEVQQNKVIPLSDEEIALDAASSEGTKSVFCLIFSHPCFLHPLLVLSAISLKAAHLDVVDVAPFSVSINQPCDDEHPTLSCESLSTIRNASIWYIMDLIVSDDAWLETLEPCVALDIVVGEWRKMERNLIERLPFLKDVFVFHIDDPLC